MEALKQKEDEQRTRFLWIFKKTILRIRDEERGNPIYLIRYSLFSCPWFAIKVHNILLSDDDCLHDHPWSFFSVILWNGYVEETVDYEKVFASQRRNPWNRLRNVADNLKDISWEKSDLNSCPRKHVRYGMGSILWRPNPWPHRLVVAKPAWSLVVTFRKVRVWGFYTPSGWKV